MMTIKYLQGPEQMKSHKMNFNTDNIDNTCTAATYRFSSHFVYNSNFRSHSTVQNLVSVWKVYRHLENGRKGTRGSVTVRIFITRNCG